MNRKEFLKNACGLGLCGCALSLVGAPELLHAAAGSTPATDPPDQRLAFARYQIAKLTSLHGDRPGRTIPTQA